VVLAVLRRARGIRGEIFAESLGSSPERFTPGLNVTLFAPAAIAPAGEGVPMVIENSWLQVDRLVLKFQGVDSRTDAEKLTGYEVRIPLSERPEAPEGQYYLSDLVGCRMLAPDGRLIGTVTAWYDPGGAALLEINGDDGFLVPLVEEICLKVDVEARVIVAELPEGLESINNR
jgi:16S rRNA processing protein RimM